MGLCPKCFGHTRLTVPPGPDATASASAASLYRGPERPCDYPGCHGGHVPCCDPEVNRWAAPDNDPSRYVLPA